jgi:hypothetical protein
VELYWQGKAEVFGEKRVPVTLCLLQVPLDWPGIEPGLPHKRVENERLIHDKVLLIEYCYIRSLIYDAVSVPVCVA